MFWTREKTMRVELVNSQIRFQAEPTALPAQPDKPPASQKASEINADFVLKLLTWLAVALQGGLAVYGYSALTGHYDTFGISMGELDIGVPSLLFYGYLFLFMDVFGSATKVPLIGPALPAIAALLIAGYVVWWLKRTSSFEAKLSTTTFLGSALFILVILPALAVTSGQKLALKDIDTHGLSVPAGQLQRTHIIQTDRGEKQGMLITATEKYTFLLVGTEVLKISNDGNKVMRITQLSDKSQPAAPTPGTAPSGDVIKPAA